MMKNNSAIEIVYVLYWWVDEQCPVTSLPLGDSTSSGPRGKSPKSAHLLTYSQPSTQASTGPGTVSPPTQIERDPTCRCCDHRQLLRRSRRIPRRLARSSAAAEVPCPSAEHPRAGDSNDSSGGAAGTHLRGVSYQHQAQRIPGHSSG